MARKFEILCIGVGSSVSRAQLREHIIEKIQEHDKVSKDNTDETLALSVFCKDDWLTYEDYLKDLSLEVPDVIFGIEFNNINTPDSVCGYVVNGFGNWKTRGFKTPPEKPPDVVNRFKQRVCY